MPRTALHHQIGSSTRLIGRRGLLVRSALTAIAAPVAMTNSGKLVLAQESGGKAVPEAVAGQNAFEFVATIHQRGFEFELYGYITRVAGIEPGLLFTNPDPTNRGPADARLTIYGAIGATSRSILEQVFDVNGEGTIGIYFAETGGSSFDDPATFQAGVPVAGGIARIQSVITVIAPQTGLSNGYGDVAFDSSTSFKIGDAQFQFTTGEQLLRLSYTGLGTLLDPELPESMIFVAGNASVVS